jgi:large subunit GTPase 1
LSTAELADTDFTTERTQNIKIISTGTGTSSSNPYLLSKEETVLLREKHAVNNGKLTVPRRPRWTEDTTAHQLDRMEKDAFLEWRRGLALLQENNDLLLTPFERNVEVWRQLWRVVDRSDLVVQIVDARNPLLFRSEDLELYVKELDNRKRNLLLINKADLMTLEQRKIWAKYFTDHGIRYAFFSAKTALRIVEEQLEAEKNESSDDEEVESSAVAVISIRCLAVWIRWRG